MMDIQSIEENTISIFVPMVIKRRGGGHATMIIPKGAQNSSLEAKKPNYDHRLINAFAKAYKWQQAMLKNPKLTTYIIAEKESSEIFFSNFQFSIASTLLLGRSNSHIAIITPMIKETCG